MNYIEKCRWLSEFYREAVETGQEIQFRVPEWSKASGGPSFHSNPDDWRIKSEPPKAWVVWLDDGARIRDNKNSAEELSRMHHGSVIQEITRPEQQASEPKSAAAPEWLDDMKASRDEHAEVQKILKHRISLGEAVLSWLSNTEVIIDRLDAAIAKAEGRGE
jgi:hypothetical protein